MMNSFLSGLNNGTVRYATERAKSAMTAMNRELLILYPTDSLQWASLKPDQAIPALIGCFDLPDKDWAANLVLYAVTGRDVLPLAAVEYNPEVWRRSQKQQDLSFWIEWWAASRTKIHWDGKHLSSNLAHSHK